MFKGLIKLLMGFLDLFEKKIKFKGLIWINLQKLEDQ
jgi:hypothetical protein